MAQTIVAAPVPVVTEGYEYGMTFQVTLVNSGGLVCASDRMFVDDHYIPPAYREQRARRSQRFASTKFLTSDNGVVACAFAGGPQAKNMAEVIADKCSENFPIKWENSIRSAIANIRGSGNYIQDEVIVVFKGSRPLAVRVSKIGDTDPSIITIEQHICTGDLSGTAHFLVEHLWRENIRVSDLQKLALLTIAFAAKENPYGIGEGANLLTLTTGDFDIREYRKEDLATICDDYSSSLLDLLTEIDMPNPLIGS